MLWFTADTHFGHTNIIRHGFRPISLDEVATRLNAAYPSHLILPIIKR